MLLPASDQHPLGALLALGSGSRPNRQQGVVVGLDGAGLPTVPAQTIDLSGLYQPLRGDFRDLNIEGAFIDGPALCLLQRANKGNGRSACIRYPLAQVQDWISGLRKAPPAPESLAFYALGEAGGAPYGFTDGAGLPGGGWIFSAVAEDTADSYLDGACAGSAIGWVDRHGVMQRFETAEGSPKIEGIALAEGGRRLLMVTDADDPDRPAALLVLDL